MADTRRRYPFVVRALFFALVYTVIAVAAEYLYPSPSGTHEWPDSDKLGRYFLIGIVIAGVTLLFLNRRRPKLPK